MSRICIVHRFDVQVPVQDVRERCDLNSIRLQNPDLHRYIINLSPNDSFQNLEGIMLMGHPMDSTTGRLDTSKRELVLCLGLNYTIYKKLSVAAAAASEEVCYKKIAARNSYNLATQQYDVHPFTKIKSFSYWGTQQMIARGGGGGEEEEEEGDDQQQRQHRYYSNRHNVIQEFIYNCNARFDCFKCGKVKTDMKCMSCGNQYVCISCHPDHSLLNDKAMRTNNQSLILRTDEIPRVKLHPSRCGRRQQQQQQQQQGGPFIFSHRKNSDGETVTCIHPNQLPWDEPTSEPEIKIQEEEQQQGLAGFSIKVY